ncbi:MAG TPA: hypothetical protein VFS67_21785 [Polyangiaceae bacterium]|nr:hypothetical protein [Polyangiaceae bacterium]
MADPPPRPPPLPPRPLAAEPFPRVDRDAETPRSGVPRVVPPEPAPLPNVLDLIAALRQDVVLLRESLPPHGPSFVPTDPPPSKGQVAARAVGKGSQWLMIAIGALGVAAQIAHIYRPDLEGPIQVAIKLLGGTP